MQRQEEKKPGEGRSFHEKILPEAVKKLVESVLEAVLNPEVGIRKVVPELKLRKEFAEYILKQMDETKNLALRIIAHEVRTFLENTDLASAITNVLTSVAFEVKIEVRFVKKGDSKVAPSVKTTVRKKGSKKKPARKKK